MENDTQTEAQQSSEAISVKVKTPKRILHFSDGTLEEYSDDDEQTENDARRSEDSQPVIDPKTLPWGPWTTYMLWAAGSNTLAACDYVGEWLASAFGITTPRYYFEIEEYKQREAAKRKLEEHQRGWCENPDDELKLVTKEIGVEAGRSNTMATTSCTTPVSDAAGVDLSNTPSTSTPSMVCQVSHA